MVLGLYPHQESNVGCIGEADVLPIGHLRTHITKMSCRLNVCWVGGHPHLYAIFCGLCWHLLRKASLPLKAIIPSPVVLSRIVGFLNVLRNIHRNRPNFVKLVLISAPHSSLLFESAKCKYWLISSNLFLVITFHAFISQKWVRGPVVCNF